MSNTFRTSLALLGLSTLLLTEFAAAQPTTESPSMAPMASEPTAQPAAAPVAPASAPTPAQTQLSAPATQGATEKPVSSDMPAADASDVPQTLFSSQNKFGGYGGLDVAYTRLVGKNAALVCGGGALLVDHAFSFGLVGCGNATRLSGQNYGNVAHESDDRFEFGYGGLVLGYQFFPRQIYNLSLTAMVGGGATAIVNYRDHNNDSDHWRDHDDVKTHDTVFVAEPRLTGYVNLTRWARMGAFAGYRFVGGANLANLSNSDLAGPVAGGTLQFGWF